VYSPLAVTVPPVALHVTGGNVVAPVLHEAVTPNCCVAPAATDDVLGDTVSDTNCATSTTAVSTRPQAQAAITANRPARLPAVNKPVPLMVPPVAV
jgi:hypothetical protein